MGDITLTLGKLLLDESNPRHRPVTTQEAAMVELIRRGPAKLLNLAKDIAAIGLSPVERPIVMKSGTGNRYVMLEGNRRLAALRLLTKPDTCPEPALRAKFEALAAVAEHRPQSVRCFEVASREEAWPLLDRRHLGEMEGIGVVRWSAMQRARHANSLAHQERMALTTLEWLDGKSAAGANQHLADLLEEVAEDKFTTFGRLAGDPDFRSYCGYDIKGDVFILTDSGERVIVRLTMVLEDFRRKLTVTRLKGKPDRRSYIDGLRARMSGADEPEGSDEDDEDGAEPDDANDGSSSGSNSSSGGGDGADDDTESDTEEDAAGGRPTPPPMKLFVGVKLHDCSLRLRSILYEVQSLPLKKYPNSAAALIRMVIELAVMEGHAVCGWPPPAQKDKSLRHFVSNAVRQLDPSQKAERYLQLRQELNKKDSLINTVTLNAFLHNPNYSPSPPDMRAISDTYSVLLTDINGAIRDAKDSAP